MISGALKSMVNTLMTASGNTGVVVLHEGAGQSHVVLAMINRLVRPYDKNYPAGRFRSISSIMPVPWCLYSVLLGR